MSFQAAFRIFMRTIQNSIKLRGSLWICISMDGKLNWTLLFMSMTILTGQLFCQMQCSDRFDMSSIENFWNIGDVLLLRKFSAHFYWKRHLIHKRSNWSFETRQIKSLSLTSCRLSPLLWQKIWRRTSEKTPTVISHKKGTFAEKGVEE